ncbi:hypothetical protein S7711_05666 [Stachybotrys chartarum IBT 7711]|uniref:Mitochondrial import inner membrane translocase subunit Tim21 n=1 Tax=Stachybotrys chartarum (strain CBS 109288 / IBT 7711) TaxID=1280523 RepID=A0A084B1H4_STACB|nr:hypothetical protein S7711_05666 [Stachybotrys chartarum IBT 7711]
MMKSISPVSLLRPATTFTLTPSSRHSVLLSRTYATHNNSLGAAPSSGPRRRTVTPFNDDGFTPWNELSAGEKAARATQQSFNFGFVVVGLVLTGGVGYVLWTEVFSPDSKITHFNRAVDKIKKDHRCLQLLGDSKRILAHGEPSWNKWRRARPVAATESTDQYGNQHLKMHFYVDGPSNDGVARLHMVKHRGQHEYEYMYLFLDVKGHERIYLENAETSASGSGRKQLSLFGVKWG